MEKSVVQGRRLGKVEAEEDAKTLDLSEIVDFELAYHELITEAQHLTEGAAVKSLSDSFDWDATRTYPFRDSIMGNDRLGDCVFAADMKHLHRMQRFETHRLYEENTTDQNVIDEYMRRNNGVDRGYSMLQRQRERRREGWMLDIPKSGLGMHAYRTFAFGTIPAYDVQIIQTAIRLFQGVQIGVGLPWTAYNQLRAGQPWDYVPNAGADGQAYSWGGHAMYLNRWVQMVWDPRTWGGTQLMTQKFMEAYCDEIFVPIDALDHVERWLHPSKLLQAMKDKGIQVLEQQ